MPIETPVTKRSVFNVFRRKLDCIRYGTGNHVNGVWDAPDSKEFTIEASVQGVDNESIQTVPEGYRDKEVYVLYTDSKMQTVVVGIRNPDVVIIDGDKYQVVKVTERKNFPSYAIRHYEVIVVKINMDKNEHNSTLYEGSRIR